MWRFSLCQLVNLFSLVSLLLGYSHLWLNKVQQKQKSVPFWGEKHIQASCTSLHFKTFFFNKFLVNSLPLLSSGKSLHCCGADYFLSLPWNHKMNKKFTFTTCVYHVKSARSILLSPIRASTSSYFCAGTGDKLTYSIPLLVTLFRILQHFTLWI